MGLYAGPTSKDGVNANNGREPGRSEDEQERQSHDTLRGTLFQTTGTSEHPEKGWSHCKGDKENPTGYSQDDVDSCNARAIIDEGNASRE